MLTLLIICFIVGSIGGVLQGMLGIGTGIIVIPLLTFILPDYGISNDLAIHVALATSMAAIIISSISSLINHHKHLNIRWPIFKKIVFFSIVGSLVGAIIASYMPAKILKTIFAFFIFFTAAKMLKKKKISAHYSNELDAPLWIFATSGLFTGFISSILGIGGGLFMVPFLYSRHLEMRHAVGTSTAIGLPIAAIGTLTYVMTGFSQTHHINMVLGYLHWPAFLAISLGGFIFAGIGVKLTKFLNPVLLQRIFAIVIILIGVKMLWY